MFSSPTTATLAISSFSVIAQQPQSATYGVYVYQVPVSSDGATCSPSAIVRLLAFGGVAPGAPGGQSFPAPLVVKPVGSAEYCLDAYDEARSGTMAGTDSVGVQVVGYVVSGTYTGIGVPSPTPDRTTTTTTTKGAAGR